MEFVWELARAVLIQLAGVFGIFFLLGFILSKLQQATQRAYFHSVGWKGILWTGWLGTPVHELGHLLFAVLFGHQIRSVRWFAPNESTGELGSVEHAYNPASLYQRIGNFFIGAAPMIVGSIALGLLAYYMLPGGSWLLKPIPFSFAALNAVLGIGKWLFIGFISIFSFTSISFWIFVYLTFCIASHLAPSKADQRQMWSGFGWLVAVIAIINAILLFAGVNITDTVLYSTHYLGLLAVVFLYAIAVSLIHLIFASFLRLLRRQA